MNKNILKLAVVALALVSTACTNNPEENFAPAPVFGKYTATINAATAEGTLDGTRVSYCDGVGVEWNTGEQIGVASVNTDNGAHHEFTSAPLTDHDIQLTDNHRYAANFNVDYDWAGDYYVFHPRKDGGDYSKDAIPFEVAELQTQHIKGNMDSGICMVGKTTVNLPDENGTKKNIDVKFKVVNTVLRFEIYAEDGAKNETITEVSVETPNNIIAGTMNAKFSVNADNEVEATCTLPSEGANKVTVKVEDFPFIDHVPTAYEDGRGIYAAILPCDVAANGEGSVIYTVKTRANTYTFKSTMARTFEAGKYYPVKLNLQNQKAVVTPNEAEMPEHLYIMGSALEGGNWNPADAVELTKVEGENVFEGKMVIKSGGDVSFRFITQKENRNGYFIKGDNDNKVRFSLNEPKDSNYNFTVEDTAIYSVRVALNDAENGTVEIAKTYPDELYIIGNVLGSADYWKVANAVKMTRDAADLNKFTYEGWLSAYASGNWGEFRFVSSTTSGKNQYNYNDTDKCLNYSYSDATYSNYKLKSYGESGLYRVTVTLAADGQTGSVDVELLRPEHLYIFGAAIREHGDNNWSTTKQLNYYGADGNHKFHTICYLNANSLYRFVTHADGDLHDYVYGKGDGKSNDKVNYYVNLGEGEKKDYPEWNFTSPAVAGYYEIVVDFDNEGALSCTPITPCLVYEDNWETDSAKRHALTKKEGTNVYYTVAEFSGWYKFAQSTTMYNQNTFCPSKGVQYSKYFKSKYDVQTGNSGAGPWFDVPNGGSYYVELDLDNDKMRIIPADFHLVGINGNWDKTGGDAMEYDWTTMEATKTVEIDDVSDGSANKDGFKIRANHVKDWNDGVFIFSTGTDVNPVADSPTDTNVLYLEKKYAENDYKWKFTETGTYTITLDLSGWGTDSGVTLQAVKQ